MRNLTIRSLFNPIIAINKRNISPKGRADTMFLALAAPPCLFFSTFSRESLTPSSTADVPSLEPSSTTIASSSTSWRKMLSRHLATVLSPLCTGIMKLIRGCFTPKLLLLMAAESSSAYAERRIRIHLFCISRHSPRGPHQFQIWQHVFADVLDSELGSHSYSFQSRPPIFQGRLKGLCNCSQARPAHQNIRVRWM